MAHYLKGKAAARLEVKRRRVSGAAWRAVAHPETGRVYYFNDDTAAAAWVKPRALALREAREQAERFGPSKVPQRTFVD